MNFSSVSRELVRGTDQSQGRRPLELSDIEVGQVVQNYTHHFYNSSKNAATGESYVSVARPRT